MSNQKIFEHLSAESFVSSLTPAELSDWATAIAEKTGMGFNAALEATREAASIFDIFLEMRAKKAEEQEPPSVEPKRQLVFCRYEAFEAAGRIVDKQMESMRRMMEGHTGVMAPREDAPAGTRSDTLARLDKTYYRHLRKQSAPRGYICGNLPVDAIVDVVEEYRTYLQGKCPDCENEFDTDGHAFGCSFVDVRPGNLG